MFGLILPRQLFEGFDPWRHCAEVYLIEEHLVFRQYNFYKQKIVYHRASMNFYERYLRANDIPTRYIESTDPHSDVRNLLSSLVGADVTFINPVDNWLEKRTSNRAPYVR